MIKRIKLIASLSFILISISCEVKDLEEELVNDMLNEQFSTEPSEDLEPGGSGGGGNSEKEEL